MVSSLGLFIASCIPQSSGRSLRSRTTNKHRKKKCSCEKKSVSLSQRTRQDGLPPEKFFENTLHQTLMRKSYSSALEDSSGMSRKLIFHITLPSLLETGDLLQCSLWILSVRLNRLLIFYSFSGKSSGCDLISMQRSSGEAEW